MRQEHEDPINYRILIIIIIKASKKKFFWFDFAVLLLSQRLRIFLELESVEMNIRFSTMVSLIATDFSSKCMILA